MEYKKINIQILSVISVRQQNWGRRNKQKEKQKQKMQKMMCSIIIKSLVPGIKLGTHQIKATGKKKKKINERKKVS